MSSINFPVYKYLHYDIISLPMTLSHTSQFVSFFSKHIKLRPNHNRFFIFVLSLKLKCKQFYKNSWI